VPAACRPSAPLTVNIDQIPLLKDAIGPGIHIQPPRLDPEKRQVVRIATMAPGCLVPIHYHTGTAEVYTFSGCWKYAEYPPRVRDAQLQQAKCRDLQRVASHSTVTAASIYLVISTYIRKVSLTHDCTR
jgi:hypothetical protein